MLHWWHRLTHMTDAKRAQVLAVASAIVIMVLLYLLGGVCLYVRAHLPGEESALLPGSTIYPGTVESGVAGGLATGDAPLSGGTPSAEPTPTHALLPTITPARPSSD